MEFKSLNNWLNKGLNLYNDKLFIAGPCSVESHEQLFQTAKELVSTNRISLLRAGVWKPRTSPNSFEGLGPVALEWLKELKQEINLPLCIEVANADHVELALKNNIDVLWLGARTTVSPFAVQEIANALTGVKIPVMIKNPINTDLDLWIGAIERISKAGITEIAAIHRGFHLEKKSTFRNQPVWNIPIQLKQKFPNLPLICDPSHICGNRDQLKEVSQTAIDYNFNGLMIESHFDPNSALSDSKQQITPSTYGQLIESLEFRKDFSDQDKVQNKLKQYREKIDSIDEEIICLLRERLFEVEKIGQLKKQENVSYFQVDRYTEQIQMRSKLSKKNGIDADFVEALYKIIHEESLKKQS